MSPETKARKGGGKSGPAPTGRRSRDIGDRLARDQAASQRAALGGEGWPVVNQAANTLNTVIQQRLQWPGRCRSAAGRAARRAGILKAQQGDLLRDGDGEFAQQTHRLSRVAVAFNDND